MSKVDDPMPQVAIEAIRKHRKPTPETTIHDRLSGKEWLRKRLERGRHGMCDDHYHLSCIRCESVKCGGESGYAPYEETKHRCDCTKETTTHIVVPFDNFGQFVSFPE